MLDGNLKNVRKPVGPRFGGSCNASTDLGRGLLAGCCILLAIAWLTLAGGCARVPTTEVTTLKAASLPELQTYLLNHKADLEQFRLRGPFAVATRENHELRLSPTERINTDLYLAAPSEKAPLVIFLHGHDSSKEDHAYQAMHLATWGMHCLALQLPNNGPWVNNGKLLARIVSLVQRSPEIIDRRIDANKIVLVGHSFGGAAVTVALAEGARAAGGILLDPAADSKELPGFLKKVSSPVMVLGADEEVFEALNRSYFYRFIRSGIAEISVRDATHEDAQYPSELAKTSGFDSPTSEELQLTFVSALTSAAFSLAATGKLEYAWTSFGNALENGKLINARKK